MRKIVLSIVLAALFAMPSMEANAVVCAAPIPGVYGLVGASPAAVSVTGVVTTILPVALFALGAENVDWATPIFGKDHVFQEYPAGQNHVFVRAETVYYAVAPVDHTAYHVMSRFGTDSIRSD